MRLDDGGDGLFEQEFGEFGLFLASEEACAHESGGGGVRVRGADHDVLAGHAGHVFDLLACLLGEFAGDVAEVEHHDADLCLVIGDDDRAGVDGGADAFEGFGAVKVPAHGGGKRRHEIGLGGAGFEGVGERGYGANEQRDQFVHFRIYTYIVSGPLMNLGFDR